MGAVATRARSELRHRARSTVFLVLAIGIAAGASLTAFAGARRTETAIDRFVASSRPAEAVVGGNPAVYARISRLPQVEATARSARPLLARVGARQDPYGLSEIASDNLDFSHPIVLSGRMPNPELIDEVVLNSSAAAHLGLRTGSSLRLRAFAPDQASKILNGSTARPTGPDVSVYASSASCDLRPI